MLYRKMGKTDWDVSALSFGGMRFPTLDSWGEIDYDKAAEMVSAAIEAGVNYLDTAWMYHEGASESFFGKFLQNTTCREKIKIATKSPLWLISSKEEFRDYFDKQRQRLQIDCVDFYLFHALNKNFRLDNIAK